MKCRYVGSKYMDFMTASSATGPGVSGIYFLGSLSILPSLINWRWVGDEAVFVCTWVATMESLLNEMLVSVDLNIVHPIWVSLERRGNSCPCATSFHHTIPSPPVFCLCGYCLGLARMCQCCWRR
jgi:hypothetical protein